MDHIPQPLPRVPTEALPEADTGYRGLVKPHANSSLPQKRSRRHPLTKQARSVNREISRTRIFAEHAIRFVKRFRILSRVISKAGAPTLGHARLFITQNGSYSWDVSRREYPAVLRTASLPSPGTQPSKWLENTSSLSGFLSRPGPPPFGRGTFEHHRILSQNAVLFLWEFAAIC